MELESLDTKVKDTLTEILGISPDMFKNTISEMDDLTLFGLSSLKLVHLVVSLESQFDLTFDGSDLLPENINSIYKIKQIINKHGK